ncbi:hypothetical protein B5X24_HaOG208509 [Helicoverpa armigera]|uniref:Uncharacterized protein n=1 Tax=Helicoverpa armigera TaxID=29058 RepID=A0A2W1BKX2_HELAM|nr:hypothetical protein B5X24_HaOG208509 [Helicoverpa armigera]
MSFYTPFDQKIREEIALLVLETFTKQPIVWNLGVLHPRAWEGTCWRRRPRMLLSSSRCYNPTSEAVRRY